MDIRLILAVVITVVLLGALWFVLQRRKRQAAERDISAQQQEEQSDRIASERLQKLAAAHREMPQDDGDDEARDEEEFLNEPEDGSIGDTATGDMHRAEILEMETAETAAPSGPDEGWAAILSPTVPIARVGLRRSWLGGRPHLPPGTPWPEHEGVRLIFYAGIDLSELPPAVWGGRGPRDGWLILFLNPVTNEPHCLHVNSIGSGEGERSNTLPADYAFFGPYGGLGQDGTGDAPIPRGFAEWPVAVEARRDTAEPNPDQPAQDTLTSAAIPNYDFADPALHPVDEAATLAMLDAIMADFARLRETRYADVEEEVEESGARVETLRRELAAVLEAEVPDQNEASDLRQKLAQAETSHNALVGEVDANMAAQTHLAQIVDMVRDHAGKNGLNPADIAQIMQGLAEVPVAWRERTADAGEETFVLNERPITQIAIGDQHPGVSMIAVAAEHAKHAYTRCPEIFSPDREAVWARIFASLSAAVGKIGGMPHGNVEGFDPDEDILLLELESSPLVGWKFANAGRLSFVLGKSDLEQGAFDRLRASVSGT